MKYFTFVEISALALAESTRNPRFHRELNETEAVAVIPLDEMMERANMSEMDIGNRAETFFTTSN